MKKVRILLALLSVALLYGCAGGTGEERAEALQRQYAEAAGYEARFRAAVVRDSETAEYTLAVTRRDGQTRVTVCEPEALAGVSAIVREDGTLALELDGMTLDAGSADPRLSAVNISDILFRAAAQGHITERSVERFEDTDEALRLCLETTLDGEKLLVTAFFDDANAPLYVEFESGGEILAYLEFTAFRFCDIVATK